MVVVAVVAAVVVAVVRQRLETPLAVVVMTTMPWATTESRLL
jgi:hypothetical protein